MKEITIRIDVDDIIVKIPTKELIEKFGGTLILKHFDNYDIESEAKSRNFNVYDSPEESLGDIENNEIMQYVNDNTNMYCYDKEPETLDSLNKEKFVEMFKEKYLKVGGNNLKRALCDLFSLGYHATNQELFSAIESNI